MARKAVGQNVEYEISDKDILTITVDLKKSQGPSKSGKTEILGSSGGNVRIYNSKNKEFVFGLNVYRYPDSE